MPVSVLSLCADAWRENSGMAVSRLGVDDVFGRVDRTSRTEDGSRRPKHREHPASGIWSQASNSNLWGLNMLGTNPASYFQLDLGSLYRL